jgi:hypothetical protein
VAALVACNPLLIWYSQEARSYALLVLLSAAALMFFARARSAPSRRVLLAWALTSDLAILTHYYAVVAIVPQAVWLLRLHLRRRDVQLALAAILACGLALIPLAASQNRAGNPSWIGHMRLHERLGQIVPQFVIGYVAPAQEILYALSLATIALALVLLVLRSDAAHQRSALLAGGLAAGGLALNLVLVLGGIDDLLTRNAIALWLPAAILVAGGLAAPRARWLGLAATLVLCATGVTAAVGVTTERNLQRPDWRGVARLLASRPAAPRAILVQHYRDLLPLSLYLPKLRFWPHGDVAVPVRELDVVAVGAPRVHLCWWGSACNLSPTHLQSSYPVPGFHAAGRRRVFQFTVLRLVARTTLLLRPRQISAGLRATTLRKDGLLIQQP